MLKLTKTGIGLLTKQYRSVLKKCWVINVSLFAITVILTTIRPNVVMGNGCASLSYNSPISDIVNCLNGAYSTMGYAANATGEGAAVSLGHGTSASGRLSVVVGINNTASGNEAVGLGFNANATGDNSVALGSGSQATESYVVAIGNRRIVSVAEGTAANNAVTVSQLGNIAAGTKILNANGESAITFGTESGQTTVGTAISTLANQLYNYYYTFRVDERVEVIDSASFFQKNFSTLQEVDLHIKNPTHLGAFTKCDEMCPQPSERFASSLSQEQMFKNNASVDAGTSRYCLRQFGDVVADLLKNTAAKSLRIYEFMNEEVRHA